MHPVLNIHEAKLANGLMLLVCNIDPSRDKESVNMLLEHNDLHVWSVNNVPGLLELKSLILFLLVAKLTVIELSLKLLIFSEVLLDKNSLLQVKSIPQMSLLLDVVLLGLLL